MLSAYALQPSLNNDATPGSTGSGCSESTHLYDQLRRGPWLFGVREVVARYADKTDEGRQLTARSRRGILCVHVLRVCQFAYQPRTLATRRLTAGLVPGDISSEYRPTRIMTRRATPTRLASIRSIVNWEAQGILLARRMEFSAANYS